MPVSQNASSFPQPSAPTRRIFLRLFIILYVPAAIILTGLVYGILKVETNLQLTRIKTQEVGQVDVASHVLAHDFEAVSSDLMVLAHAPDSKRFINSASAEHKRGMTELFVDISQQKQLYDQIRYLDVNGKEVIRVNLNAGKAEVTPAAELQDKSGRYFFRDSVRLSEGEVYVSPLDLNIEHRKIETPYKPMIRFGTPVFNHAGKKMGVVLTNAYGSKLIEDFRQAMGTDRHAMLLNRDGDWLSGPDASQEWGFMFGNKHAFAKRYPAEWQVISANRQGSFMTGAGLFTYATVYPLLSSQRSSTGSPLPVGASGHELERQEYFWKVLSLVPIADIPSSSFVRHPVIFTAYGFSLLLLAALISYLASTMISRKQWQQAVFDNETRLREITSTLGEGVYVLDADGNITFVNPEAERLLGWSREEMSGKNSHNLFHHHLEDGAPLPEAQCAISQVIQTGHVYRSEEEIFWCKDGSKMPVDVSSSPIIREGKVVGSVVAFRDVTERMHNREEIRRLAYYDTLTDLPNRRLLLDQFNHALAQARRFKRSLAVMFMDLDRFKEINDTLGHDVGDELLKVVAERMTACVRSGDTVARQGGDEFVILLAEIAHPEDATRVADKLLAALSEPVPVAEHELHITGSIGIAISLNDGTDDAQELMKQADIAMYSAKQKGRNQYCVYEK